MKMTKILIISATLIFLSLAGCGGPDPMETPGFSILYDFTVSNNYSEDVTLELQPLTFTENESGTTKWMSGTNPQDIQPITVLTNKTFENPLFGGFRFFQTEEKSSGNTFLITISTDNTVFQTLAGYPEAGNGNLKPGDWYTEPGTEIVPQKPNQYALGFGDLRGDYVPYNHSTGKITYSGEHHLYTGLDINQTEKKFDENTNSTSVLYKITVADNKDVKVELIKTESLTLDDAGNTYQG